MIKKLRVLWKVGVKPINIIAMMIYRTFNKEVVEAIDENYEYKLGFSIKTLEAHYLAGGNVKKVIQAAKILKKMGVDGLQNHICALDFSRNCALEYAQAFQKAKNKFPFLKHEEFLKRILLHEDVINQVEKGIFQPHGD